LLLLVDNFTHENAILLARLSIRLLWFCVRGEIIVSEQMREWKDQRVRDLYTIAITSRNGVIRHEALTFLGAMERAGSEDAEWAVNAIKKKRVDSSI
jgi:hypothetical protein